MLFFFYVLEKLLFENYLQKKENQTKIKKTIERDQRDKMFNNL